jgi:hypothetical protein
MKRLPSRIERVYLAAVSAVIGVLVRIAFDP